MKTINVPLVGRCPQWDGRIPDDKLGDFKPLLAEVYQLVLRSAARELVDDAAMLGWHRHLFVSFVPLSYYAGHFRQQIPSMPCLAQEVYVGGVQGWPHQTTPRAVSTLSQQIQRQLRVLELRWSLLTPTGRATELSLTVANLVGGFIQIHPFINGNGRTSRLLWQWALLRFGVPVQCTTYPRPDPPYERLMSAAMRGDYIPLAHAVLSHLARHAPQRV